MTPIAMPEQIAQLTSKEREILAAGYAKLISLMLVCQASGLRGKGVLTVSLNPRVCETTRRFEVFDSDGAA